MVRFVWHNFPVVGDESVLAAQAAACAGDEGKFWEFHDKLFEEQRGENQGAFASEKLTRFAEELGIDSQQVRKCLEPNVELESLRAQMEAGENRGVRSTPTVFVNGERASYPMNYDYLRNAVDRLLKQPQQTGSG